MEKGVEQSETEQDIECEVSTVKSSNGSDNYQDEEGVVDDDEAIPVEPSHSQEDRETNSRASPVRWLFWSAAFILTATVSAAVGASLALLNPRSPILAPLQLNNKQQEVWSYGFGYQLARPVNILVMGIDRVPNVPESPKAFAGRSDTMLLLRLEPTPPTDKTPGAKEGSGEVNRGAVKILSIPRDTRVEFPGRGMTKINQANADGGAALAARVVSRNLNNVPVDRYIRVTTGAFRELVDLVGGVEVFVPQRMYYADTAQNLKIDLEQGWQTLNGDQAEQFARFRNDRNGDIGRVQRQQALLKSLRQRLTNPSVLPRLPQIIQVMWKYVDTNLTLEETLGLVNFGLSLDEDDLKMVMLPGQFADAQEYATSYWMIDPGGKDRVMREYFHRAPLKTVSSPSRSPNRVRIAIQNATNQPEAGRGVVEYLRRKGFKNVYLVPNWPDLQRQTQIIVQRGDMEAANYLKKVLGLGKLEADSTGSIESDLTIRVGEDWIK